MALSSSLNLPLPALAQLEAILVRSGDEDKFLSYEQRISPEVEGDN